ncbi:MAG: hypothetical protein ACR2K2_13485 [Mycobacteriales bacterium]
MGEEHEASWRFWEDRWPYAAEKVEMVSGCPYWNGGPYGQQDVDAAQRAFPEHRAEIDEDGYGLLLVPVSWTWRIRSRPSAFISPPPDDDAPFTRSWHASKSSADAAVGKGEWVEQVDR